MPVITVSRSDLEKLVGRKLGYEDIMDLLPRVKCEVEEVTNGEISYEAPHDRPDLFSVEGLARAIRLLLGIGRNDFIFIDKGLKAYNEGVPKRPYVAFAVVEDLELDEEAISQLMNLQEKLHITYARKRRKASIGLYDLDKIEFPIYYRLVDPVKTRFTPLNETKEMNLYEILEYTEKGREYKHLLENWEKLPILVDSKGTILSMPPIINSEDTRVTTSTRRVLIDSTGLDKNIVVDMVTIMATSVAERSKSRKIVFVNTLMSNGETIRSPRSYGKKLSIKLSDVKEVIGIDISFQELLNSLRKMGHKILGQDSRAGKVFVETPMYRLDIFEWIDLVEDVAMAIGYDIVGSKAYRLPPAYSPGRVHPLEYLTKRLKLLFVGMGFMEVVNYMMSNPWIQNEVFEDNKPLIKVSNPKMEKYTCLRRWLTPGLLEVVLANQERFKYIKIFESGDVAIIDPSSETGAIIERRIGFAISHERATLTDALAVLRTLSETLRKEFAYEYTVIKGLLPERTAVIKVGSAVVGFVGEVHPKTLLKLGITRPVVVGEIIVNKLLDLL